MASAMAMAVVVDMVYTVVMAAITVVMVTVVVGVTTGWALCWVRPLWVVQFMLPVHLAMWCLKLWWCSSNMCRLVVWHISAQRHNSSTRTYRLAKCLGSRPITKTKSRASPAFCCAWWLRA